MSTNINRGALLVLLTAWMVGGGCVGELTGDEPPVVLAPEEDPTYNTDDDNTTDDGRQLFFYYGPMKLMGGEAILYSIERITGHNFGAWVETSPDPGTNAFIAAGNGDDEYYRHCRLLGGCLEHRIPLGRTSFVGTAYVLELEKSVTEACYNNAVFGIFPGNVEPTIETTVTDIINHQYVIAFGTEPDEVERGLSETYFAGHLLDPEFTNMTPMESAGRGHCRSILATNRFLFY